MLNLYSCGCTVKGDVPILSRCDEHPEGIIVSALYSKVKKKRSFRVDDLRIRHHPLDETLATLSEKKIKFDLICSYPEQDPLYAHDQLMTGWHIKTNPLFAQLHDALTADGHMFLIVEQSVLARTLYDALMHGFHQNSISVVSCVDHILPLHEKWPEFYTYKFAILFSKNDSGRKLPYYMRMSKLHHKLRRKFEPQRVLDISCIHKPFLSIADKTVGVCEDEKRYIKLKRELCN